METAAGRPRSSTAFRGACAVVAVVAGLAGSVMLVQPGETDRYFSWPIGPPALAATVGAFYLASAVLFAILGVRGYWLEARGIAFGILAFTLPTLAAMLRHQDLFDWGRWEAIAWVVLFVGSPLTFSSFLYLQRGQAPGRGRNLPAATRVVLAVLGAVYALLAVALLLAPGRLQEVSPFALPGLSGRFLGSWSAFLAVVAIFALWRNRGEEAAMPLVALVLWPAAAALAAVRSWDVLGRRFPYLLVFVALATVAALALARVRSLSSAPRALN